MGLFASSFTILMSFICPVDLLCWGILVLCYMDVTKAVLPLLLILEGFQTSNIECNISCGHEVCHRQFQVILFYT